MRQLNLPLNFLKKNNIKIMQKVNLKKIFDDALIPLYATSGSAGFDLYAHNFPDNQKDYLLAPGEKVLIGTGIALQADGFEFQIRSRSGLAFKHGVIVLNSPGTIDSDYIEEIKVLLINTSAYSHYITKNDRIAQAVLSPIVQADFNIVDGLVKYDRNGGFGSTGK